MQPLIKKYYPRTVKDVQGQEKALGELKNFVENFKKQKKKAALLYGPSGIGKTSMVHALAHDSGYEIVEINASDFRNHEHINSLLGNAIKQQSLFSKGKIILVDEMDGLSGREDRGGVGAITKLIAETTYPIIMTATNPWDTKLTSVRNKAMLIQLHTLNYLTIFSILKKICVEEKIKFKDDVLKSLARRSGGDLRAAINDLQILAGKGEITKEDLEELSQRNQIEGMIQALLKVFKTTDPEIAIKAFDNVDEDLDKCMLWIDENLPKEYTKPEDLAKAYDKLSKADVFRGRIRRWQNWRFLTYINQLLTVGVALSKNEKYHKFVQYKPTVKLLKLWRANLKYQKRKAIAQKISEKTHSSTKEVLQDTLPYLKVIFRKNRSMAEKLTEELDLDKEEVAWLKK
jgi:replication factor C large subunit